MFLIDAENMHTVDMKQEYLWPGHATDDQNRSGEETVTLPLKHPYIRAIKTPQKIPLAIGMAIPVNLGFGNL